MVLAGVVAFATVAAVGGDERLAVEDRQDRSRSGPGDDRGSDGNTR